MDKASLKLTDVTVRELEVNITEDIAEANKALETKTRATRVLRNFDEDGFHVLFQRLDEAKLSAELLTLVHADFAKANVEMILATTVSALIVFDKYFAKQAPFGPAKKKSEIPDAFVLTALEEWCRRNKKELYVVTSDGDMQSGCSDNGPLYHLASIAEFVDLVLREENDKTDFLAQLFIDNPKAIVEAIRDKFEDERLYLLDEDGDGEATATNIRLGAPAVVSISEDEITIELDVSIAFNAHIEYADQNATSYDHEEHTAFVWNYIHADLDKDEQLPVEISIAYDPKNYLDYQVVDITLNNGEPLRIYVDEKAKTHWK